METKTPLFIKIILGIATIVGVIGAYFFVDYLFSDKVEAPNISINLKAFTVCQSGSCFDTDTINLQSKVLPGCLEVEGGAVCGNFTIKNNQPIPPANASSTQK